MRKTILLISLILFCVVCNVYAIEDKVVAVINNEVITKAELDAYISLIKMQIGEEGWKNYGMSERSTLENLIENRLMVQEAKKKKIEADERSIESRLAKVRNRFPSPGDFSDFLSKQGLSLTGIKETIKEQILTDKLIASQIRNRILISPSEVTEYYESHKSDFYYP